MSDDSDSSWARSPTWNTSGANAFTAEQTTTFPTPSIPAGSKIVAVRSRHRTRHGGDTIGTEDGWEYRIRTGLTTLSAQHEQGAFRSVFEGGTGFHTQTRAWLAERPNGGEWTLADMANLRIRLASRLLTSDGMAPGGDRWSEHAEMWFDVDYNERPVSAYTGPSAAITDTSRPTVTWDYSDPEDDAQAAFRVLVTYDGGANDGLVAYDSGWVSSSETSHQVDALANNESYIASIQVRQAWAGAGTHASLADTGSFSLALDAPDAPTLVVTPDASNVRVAVEVDDPTESPDPEAEWFVVEYSDAGGSGPWTTLRGGGRVDAPGPVVLFDYEAPFGQQRWYRVRSFYDSDGQDIGSDAVVESAVLAGVEGRWVTDVQDPELVRMRLREFARERAIEGREVVHHPVGLAHSVVESEVPSSGARVSFRTIDGVGYADVRALLESTRTLLYRDRRETTYFRWVGQRVSAQVGADPVGVDVHEATMVAVGRPDA